jgi:2-oxo-3-hexenedioate decarboxylase
VDAGADASRRLADTIAAARAARQPIPAPYPAPSVESAYDAQSLLRRGRARRGWKVGMVSPAKLAQFGMSEPVYGPVYPGMLHSGNVSLGQFMQPRLEPELAVVLAADIRPGASAAQAARSVVGLFLAVDILDTVWADYRLDPAHAVADGVNGGGFLLGDQLIPLTTEGQLALYVGGRCVGEGSVAALGDPVARCAWLAEATGGLEAGEIIFLGSPAANVPAEPGVLEVHGPYGSVLLANLMP